MTGEPEIRPVELSDLDSSTELAQTGFWGEYKSHFGHSPRAFEAVIDHRRVVFLVLERPIGGGFSLGYVPYGPHTDEPLRTAAVAEPRGAAAVVASLGRALAPHLSPRCVFVRFDLPWAAPNAVSELPGWAAAQLRRPGIEIQPRHTVVVDIAPGEEDILRSMHRKTRYNIRLSLRRGGVEVSEGGERDVETWYRLKIENDRRDGIVTHSLEYYRDLFRTVATYGPGAPGIRLLLAKVEGEVLGGVILSICGPRARYLHGASATRARATMFTYALQWRAIELAREQGCTSYDLYGIPPTDDPGHPMHGLYRFKTGFGGGVLHRYGCYDVVLRRGLYAALRTLEKVRYAYYKRLRRRIRTGAGASSV